MYEKLYQKFKNKEYLSYLIRSYKNGTNDQFPSAFKSPATSDKRKSIDITPPEEVNVAAAPSMCTNNVQRELNLTTQ